MSQRCVDRLTFLQAIVTIDASMGNLGAILTVNPATTRVFGYSRWQLERRNIAMLMPQPIAGLHDMMMQRFLVTGGGECSNGSLIIYKMSGMSLAAFQMSKILLQGCVVDQTRVGKYM